MLKAKRKKCTDSLAKECFGWEDDWKIQIIKETLNNEWMNVEAHDKYSVRIKGVNFNRKNFIIKEFI